MRFLQFHWLRIALLLMALLSGVDDALEGWMGIVDLFNLDVHHGVIGLSLFQLMKAIDDMNKEFSEVKLKLPSVKDKAPLG